MAKAKAEFKLHGSHEVFYDHAPEVDLQFSVFDCSKHPEHPNFHPFQEFRKKHIPEQHRTEDVYNWIRLSGELTVRIRAFYVSKARPQHFANSSDEYPFAEQRGEMSPRFGTGYVTYVALEDSEEEDAVSVTEETQFKGMQNSAASNLSKGKRVHIAVSTSAHVVFNEEETNGMKVDLFYDSKKQTEQIKTLHGPFKTALLTVVGDWFEFICHTEDLDLFTKLNDDLNRVNDLESKLSKDSSLHDIAAIVSHPHGSYKHVTVGQLLPAEPLVTGGSNSFSKVTFHPDNYCIFDRNSKLTYGQGTAISLPHEMKITFPDGTRYDLSQYKTDYKVLTSFSISPLQDMAFVGNQAFNWPANVEFLCLCDSQLHGQTINNNSDDEFDAIIQIPKGTTLFIDVDKPMEVGRRFMHFGHLKSPVFCEEILVLKRLRFNAHTCPGSSGAKVLFLKHVPTVGFTHSEAFDQFSQSGPGFSCIYGFKEG